MSTTTTTTAATTVTVAALTAATLWLINGECPATNNGRHHVRKGGSCCSKCGAR